MLSLWGNAYKSIWYFQNLLYWASFGNKDVKKRSDYFNCISSCKKRKSWCHNSLLSSQTGVGDEMKKALDNATKIVNFIKERPVHSRIVFLKKKNGWKPGQRAHTSPAHTVHTEIKWLGRGRVLNRVFQLKAELEKYFQKLVFHIRLVLWRSKMVAETSILSRHLSSHEPSEEVYIRH